MKVKRTLALSVLLVCLFAVPAFAGTHIDSNSYGRAKMVANEASGMMEIEALTERYNTQYYGFLKVTTTYQDGDESVYNTGHVKRDSVYDHSWEYAESYKSTHMVCEKLPYTKLKVTYYE